MKKIVGLVVAGFLLGSSVTVLAKQHKDAPETKAPAPAVPQMSNAKREEMKKALEEKKKELNGSEWKVTLNTGGKSEGTDVLTFQNGQVKSKYFADKGFPASNYTLSIPEGSDMTTWETMQTHPKGNVVFFRGEWKEKTMRGIISEQVEKDKSKDYSFSSIGMESIAPSTEKPKAETAPETQGGPVAGVLKSEGSKGVVAPFNPGTTDEITPKNTGNYAKKG
jgi:hypothetical protein